MSEPVGPESLRAGNADRERVVAHLNGAFAEGRLDVHELDERVAAAYAAKTIGQLRPLTADLPISAAPAPRPAPPPARPAPAEPEPVSDRQGRRAAVAGALGLFLVNVLVWAAVSLGTREWVYFWPVWTAIPLVFAVANLVGQGRRRDR
jgi:hypothetical protein